MTHFSQRTLIVDVVSIWYHTEFKKNSKYKKIGRFLFNSTVITTLQCLTYICWTVNVPTLQSDSKSHERFKILQYKMSAWCRLIQYSFYNLLYHHSSKFIPPKKKNQKKKKKKKNECGYFEGVTDIGMIPISAFVTPHYKKGRLSLTKKIFYSLFEKKKKKKKKTFCKLKDDTATVYTGFTISIYG